MGKSNTHSELELKAMPPKRNTQARTHQSGPHPSEANSSGRAHHSNPPIANPNSNPDPVTHQDLQEFASLLTAQLQEQITQALRAIPIRSSPNVENERTKPSPKKTITPIHKPTPLNYYVEDVAESQETPFTQNRDVRYTYMHNARKEHSHQPTRGSHPNPSRERERKDPDPNREREERRQDPNRTKARSVMDAREIITSRKLRTGGIDARALINSKRKEREHTYQQPPFGREEVSHQSPLKPDQDKFEEGGP